MPIKIQKDLPARSILEKENIFLMDEERATSQNIRPLQILILNLMPLKEDTETQLLRALSNTPIQIECTFLMLESHISKNTSQSHLNKFYTYFDDIKKHKFDGMIITGAPVELLEFEEVDYWEELTRIMEWSKTHITSTLHICWGAQAGLYYHHGIKKYLMNKKISGVYSHRVHKKRIPLVRSLDDYVNCPHSRYTQVKAEEIKAHEDLILLAESDVAGVLLVMDKEGKQIFLQGHPEYDRMTLASEYQRDIKKGLDACIPDHYFEDDNPENKPVLTWRNFSNTLFANWLNFYVYQETPYELEDSEDWII